MPWKVYWNVIYYKYIIYFIKCNNLLRNITHSHILILPSTTCNKTENLPAVISFSPTSMSFSEKGVEAYLVFFKKCLFLFLVTRLRGWYRSASLRLGTGISRPVSPTCFTKFFVAAANMAKSSAPDTRGQSEWQECSRKHHGSRRPPPRPHICLLWAEWEVGTFCGCSRAGLINNEERTVSWYGCLLSNVPCSLLSDLSTSDGLIPKQTLHHNSINKWLFNSEELFLFVGNSSNYV